MNKKKETKEFKRGDVVLYKEAWWVVLSQDRFQVELARQSDSRDVIWVKTAEQDLVHKLGSDEATMAYLAGVE